jgi:hypothetical protein
VGVYGVDKVDIVYGVDGVSRVDKVYWLDAHF